MKFKNILLIEDNLDDAELAIICLSSLNELISKITHLKDGEEAIEYLFAQGRYSGRNKSDIPSLIILDLKMPKIGGLEVLHRLRQDEIFKNVPKVVFTSSNEENDIISSKRNGANSYIQKPVDGYEFDKTLKELATYWLNNPTNNNIPA